MGLQEKLSKSDKKIYVIRVMGMINIWRQRTSTYILHIYLNVIYTKIHYPNGEKFAFDSIV